MYISLFRTFPAQCVCMFVNTMKRIINIILEHVLFYLSISNMWTRCYPYFPYSYPYFYTLISLSYPYFYGILCILYMLVQPIFSCILLNMIGNRQYIVFTSNKVQNFDIFYAYCIHACTCYTIVFKNSAMALYMLY